MNFIYETNHLILKVLDSHYAEAVCSFYLHNKNFFEAVEPPRVPGFYTVDFHRAALLHEMDQILRKSYLRLYLFEKENPDRIIGSVCFNNIRYGCFLSCSTGYKMDISFCSKGYTTEALDFSIHEILFSQFRLHRIEAFVQPGNIGSIRVLEKLNFRQEGTARDYAFLNGKWHSHFCYSLIHAQGEF